MISKNICFRFLGGFTLFFFSGVFNFHSHSPFCHREEAVTVTDLQLILDLFSQKIFFERSAKLSKVTIKHL